MKIITDNKLTKELIRELRNISSAKSTSGDIQLFYKNQIPLSGYFLEKGKVVLQKNKNKTIEILPYSFFGVNECLLNQSISFDAKILPNSTIYYLDKTTIKEILKNSNNPNLKNYINKILGNIKEVNYLQ